MPSALAEAADPIGIVVQLATVQGERRLPKHGTPLAATPAGSSSSRALRGTAATPSGLSSSRALRGEGRDAARIVIPAGVARHAVPGGAVAPAPQIPEVRRCSIYNFNTHTSKRYPQPNQIVSPGIMRTCASVAVSPFGSPWVCIRHPLCPGNGALSRLASAPRATASRLRAPFPGHSGCLMHICVRIQKMPL